MDKLNHLLKLSGFDEYPEQLAALQLALDLIDGGVTRDDIHTAIQRILADAGEFVEEVKFDEGEKPRW